MERKQPGRTAAQAVVGAILFWGAALNAQANSFSWSLIIGCQIADTAQTSWAVENGYSERNPVFGSKPSTENLLVYKAGTVAAIYYLAEHADDKRRALTVASLISCVPVVANAYTLSR